MATGLERGQAPTTYKEALIEGQERKWPKKNYQLPKTVTVGALTEQVRQDHLFQDIDKLGYSPYVYGLQSSGKRGFFDVTFKDMEEKDALTIHWINAADKGDSLFRPIEKIAEENYTLTLKGIPLEYPDSAAQQYLHKYLIAPVVTKQEFKDREIVFRSTNSKFQGD